MKLYKVTLKGFYGSKYKQSYVVAKHPTDAYERVRCFFVTQDLGFTSDRELDNIALIADEYQYSDDGTMLFLPEEIK